MAKVKKKITKKSEVPEAPLVSIDEFQPENSTVPIGDLVNDPDNAKRHPERNLLAIEQSLKKFGQVEPLVVQKGTNIVIGGNGRLDRMRKLVKAGDGRFKNVRVLYLTIGEADKRHLGVVLNRTPETGEWDDKKLAIILSEIRNTSSEPAIGFTSDETDRIVDLAMRMINKPSLDKIIPAGKSVSDLKMNQSGIPEALVDLAMESGVAKTGTIEEVNEKESATVKGIHTLKSDIVFPSDEIFQIPPLRLDRLSECPTNIKLWTGTDRIGKSVHQESEYYLAMYGKSLDVPDWGKTILGFYSEDDVFNDAWITPAEFTTMILQEKPLAVIGPNFSYQTHMPTAEKIWVSFQRMWVQRFWQEAGLNIIPDVWLGVLPSDYVFAFAGIPVGVPCVSLQLQTTKNDTEISLAERRETLRYLLDTVQPQSILVYGDLQPKKRHATIDGIIPSGFPVINVLDWNARRRPILNEMTDAKKKRTKQIESVGLAMSA